MNKEFEHLFQKGSIGKINTRNRIVMAPMGTNYAGENGEVTNRLINYYAERAKGGAGLIIVEVGAVDHPEAKAMANQLRIDNDKFIPGLSELTDRVHNHGAKIFQQLHHAGRQTAPNEIEGKQPVSASPIKGIVEGKPRKLETQEVEELVTKFVDSAEREKRAGFDGVEVHGAHGYLIGQFISPRTNKRDDKYGGDLEDRLTFPLEIIEGIRERVGEDYPLSFRLSANEFVEGGHGIEESKKVAKKLEIAGIDVLHISAGTYESMATSLEPMNYEEGWKTHLSEQIKEVVDIPTITVGVIRKPEMANQIIKEEVADFVAIGRGQIADPYFAEKAAKGKTESINRCISCNKCIGRLLDDRRIRCAVNPKVGREKEFNQLKEAEERDVLVIGGGPGGMEAAKWAAERGHNVTLYEKEEELGGQMKIASKPPGKSKINWFIEYLKKEIDKFDIDLETGTKADLDTIKSEDPDEIVLATGAEPIELEIPINGEENVLQSWTVLEEERDISEQKIVVIGGGQVGCEVSEYLLEKDNNVILLEMLGSIATDMEPIAKFDMLTRLQGEDIELKTNEKVIEIDETEVKTQKNGEKNTYTADKVILAIGNQPKNELVDELSNEDYKVYLVGDAKEPRRIFEAVREGTEAGISIGALHKKYSPIFT